MKFHITALELWIWRILIPLVGIVTLVNYLDNRQQDHLIFKSIDLIETNTNQISSLIQVNSDFIETQKLDIEIIKKLTKDY